jgi:hypothetical protein
VAVGAIALGGRWWTESNLFPSEREWCSQHPGDVASWTYSTALEDPYGEALRAERLANRDPWNSDIPVIVRACKETIQAVSDGAP